jgi:hypothetical protein
MESQPDADIGAALVARGWRQGAFAPVVEGASMPYLKHVGNGSVELKSRHVKAQERLVVASHACDLERPTSVEPFVELLLCTKQRRSYLPKLAHSPRSFVVDDESGLVANAKYRMLLDKAALLDLQPEPWPSSDARLRMFEKWLGTRYDRPGFSELANREVVQPLQRVYAALVDRDPALSFALSRAVREVRVVVREESAPAMAHVLVVIWPTLTPRQADAVDELVKAFVAALNPNVVRLAASPTTASLDNVSAREYLLTSSIDLLV